MISTISSEQHDQLHRPPIKVIYGRKNTKIHPKIKFLKNLKNNMQMPHICIYKKLFTGTTHFELHTHYA
jgi:hypothetical protein